MANNGAKAHHNQIIIDAFMAKLEPIMDQRISAFKQEMQQMRKRGFTRTGVGTDEYAPKRRIDIVQGKARTDRCKELEKQSKEQKLNDDNKKYVQEMLEIMVAFQKKKRVTHQSVDAKKKSSQRLETQTPEQEQPLLIHKGPIVHTENVEAKKNTEQVVVHNQSLQTSLELSCEPKQCHTLEHENDKAKESTKGKNQLSVPTTSQASFELVGIKSWDQVAHSAQAKAEESGGNVEKHSATHHSFTCPNNEAEPFAPNSLAPSISAPNNTILTAKSTPHLLLGSKTIETHDLIQWHHFKTGYGFKYFCFNASISSIMHLFCPMSFQKETGPKGVLTSMKIKEKPPDWQMIHSKLTELQQKTTRQARLNGGRTRRNAELTHVQERAHTCFTQLKENPPEKCRRNSKQRTRGNYLDSQKRMKPELLSLGTGQTVFKTRLSETREYDAIANPSNYPTQEPILMQFSCDYPRKHCKEIDLVGNEPNLLVIVSAEEEKRFGLDNVKEFRVPCSVFDQMVPSFEALTPEKFFNQVGFLFDDCCAYKSSLKVSVSNNVFDMYRTKTEYALFRTWSELDCLLRNLLIESCKLRNHVLGLNHSKMTLDALGNESMLDHLRRLFFYSKRTFDVVSLVFVEIKERQVKDSRAKTIQFLSNQVDYGPRQQLSYQTRTLFKCTIREDDQRFKPPDLTQMRHLNLRPFFLIKEEPPDATMRLHIFRGKLLALVHFVITNLLYVYADNSDLRSNPSQVGGNDMRMDSNKQLNMRRLWSSDQKECNKLRSCQMDQLFEQRPNNLN